MRLIYATSLLVALLVPISADARLGMPDALGVLRVAMIPFELPEPFFLVPRDLPLPPVIRVKSLRLYPAPQDGEPNGPEPTVIDPRRARVASLTWADASMGFQMPGAGSGAAGLVNALRH